MYTVMRNHYEAGSISFDSDDTLTTKRCVLLVCISIHLLFCDRTQKEKPRNKLWWEIMDSNHGSHRQQIYSLPHLAALEISHVKQHRRSLKRLELVDGFEPPTY